MALTDEVAARVMGELHTLTKKIDGQNTLVMQSAAVIKNASVQIKEDSNLAVENAREATRLAQQESLAHFESNMSISVAKTLNSVATAVATKSAVQWIIGGVLLAGALAVVAGWIGYSKGEDAGNAFGYAQARDEIAAAAWANTPDGKLAFKLAKSGSLEYLVNCSRPGWEKVNGVCYPNALKGEGVYGWHLP